MSSAPEPSRIRIGIVDDTEDIRFMLRVSFEMDDRFEVVGEATNGVEAIELAAGLQPDVLVLDREMPILGGIEALPELKRVAPHMAVVVFTAYADGGLRQAALAAGAVEVREKSGMGASFIDDIAGLLVRTTSAAPEDELEVRIGPVSSSAAEVWIRNTLALLRAIRTNPDLVHISVPDDALATFTRFLHQWLATAAESETFHWAARADVATVESLLTHWSAIDQLTADELEAIGCQWSPTEGQPFFEALTVGVLDALAKHEATRDLAAPLESQWRPYWPQT